MMKKNKSIPDFSPKDSKNLQIWLESVGILVHEYEDYIHFDCLMQWKPEWTEDLENFSEWVDNDDISIYYHGDAPSEVFVGISWYTTFDKLDRKFMLVTCKGYPLDINKIVEEGREKCSSNE